MRSVASWLVRLLIPILVPPSCARSEGDLLRLWPDYRGSIRIVRDGREDADPMPVVRSRLGGLEGRIEVEYRDEQGASVHESTAPAEGGGWSRRLRISGVQSGRDIVVRAPVRAPDGARLELGVNGAPLEPEVGAAECVVILARDEATVITLRKRR